LKLSSIPQQGRTTQGVYLMRMADGDKVASTTLITESNSKKKDAEACGRPSSSHFGQQKSKSSAPAKISLP
jgi:DNA gyrase/topoisomerase IV subunit A